MQQRSSLGDWLTDFGTRMGHIALDLAVLIAVLIVALIAGRIVREVLHRLLVAIRFDALASRGGATRPGIGFWHARSGMAATCSGSRRGERAIGGRKRGPE